jgi:hypothetical protein
MPNTTRQLDLDFDRGRQLRILQNCRLPAELRANDSRHVSRITAKLLLQLIDHHARGRTCFVSVQRLADLAGCATRTVMRATQALQAISVLCVETDGRQRCNRYTIVWSELSLLCPADSPTAGDAGPRPQRRQECHLAPESSDTGAESSDTGAESSDTGVTLTAFRSAKEPPPPYPPQPNCAPAVDWRPAAAELRALGVERVQDTLAVSRQRGLSPDEVIDAVKTCRAYAGKFDRPPAAIVIWCRTGEWPAPGVLDWRIAESRRQNRADEASALRQQQASAEAAAESYKRERAALESAYGARLDALTCDELEPLIRAQRWSDFQRQNFRRNPQGACRYDLLVALHAADQQPKTTCQAARTA